jgi:hypothetical protein
LLTLRVSGLPSYGPGAGPNLIQFSDVPWPEEGIRGAKPSQPPPTSNVDLFPEVGSSNQVPAGDHPMLEDGRPPSPYPDVSLVILDRHGNEIATTYIVEHKEPELDFTLHLRASEPGATYIACAEMAMNDEIIQTVQVPFELTERA